MVKNTIGGKKGKMLANKKSGNSAGANSKLTLSSHPDEIFVCVSKVFGGGIFEVIDNNGKLLKAYLRGKMKGHNKRHNYVTLFSILLVGIRPDLSASVICDILFVYDDHDVHSLSLLPNLSIHNILHFHLNHSFTDSHSHSHSSNDPFTNLNDINNDTETENYNNNENQDNLNETLEYDYDNI